MRAALAFTVLLLTGACGGSQAGEAAPQYVCCYTQPGRFFGVVRHVTRGEFSDEETARESARRRCEAAGIPGADCTFQACTAREPGATYRVVEICNG